MKPYQISASIVVFRNNPQQVAASIRSVLSSSARIVCTVIDNSPAPDLREPVQDSGAEYVFAGRNLGFGAGHNLALQRYRDQAEYHLIQNPDIFFASDVPAELYNFMSKNVDVGLAMPRILYPDGSEQRLCKRIPDPFDLILRRFLGKPGEMLFRRRLESYELRHLDMSLAREIPCLSGCFMFVSSGALQAAGLFDARFFIYMEDVDLCRRIGRHCKTVFYPFVSVRHGYAKGSYGSAMLLRHHVRSAIRYFAKWGWLHDPERESLNRRVQLFVPGAGQEQSARAPSESSSRVIEA